MWYTPAKYHVVWCPKYRRKVLVDGIDDRLKELIKSVCNEIGAELFELEVMPDHVHLLLEVDPQYGINKAIRHIKGVTSHTLRSEFPKLKSRLPTLWTNSYFVSTVGGAPLSVIKEYIEQQKKCLVRGGEPLGIQLSLSPISKQRTTISNRQDLRL